MKSKPLLITPLLLAAAGTLRAETPQPAVERPNVLLIYVDDLKPTLGCFGDTVAVTPNIDALGASGTIFRSSYCQQSLSGPTRVSLLTGLRPDHTLIWSMPKQMREYYPGIVTMPQYFAGQGYVTAAVGKIFDHRTVDKGHDTSSWTIPYISPGRYLDRSVPGAGSTYLDPATRKAMARCQQEAQAQGLDGKEAHLYVSTHAMPSTECMDVADNAYRDGAIALAGAGTLRKLAAGKQPFFLAVGFSKPHLPFVAPKKYWDLYDRERIPLAEFQQKAVASPEIAYHGDYIEVRSFCDIPPLYTFCDEYRNNGIISQDKQRELIHGYYACTSYVDRLVGEMLEALRESGADRNTIVVFVGDHGWHLGDHGLWAKATNFEQAARAPLIIRDPRIGGGVVEHVVEFVDVFPTLCSLCGIAEAPRLAGTDLTSCMRQPEKVVKPYAVSQYYRFPDIMGYSIRTDDMRYTVWFDRKYRTWQPYDAGRVVARELYDCRRDPQERVCVIGRKEYRAQEARMQQLLEEYIRSENEVCKEHNRLRKEDYMFN